MANSNQLCRACLTAETSFTYILFENLSSDVYSFCTSVEVSQDDELPKAICNACYENIIKYSEFKRLCIQSQNTLLGFKNNIKYEIEECNSADTREIGNESSRLKTEIINVSIKLERTDETENDYLDGTEFPDDLDLRPEDEINVSIPNVSDCENSKSESEQSFAKKTKSHNNTLSSNSTQKKKRQIPKMKKTIRKRITVKVKRKQFIYTCEVCRKKFNYKERFEAHKLEHEGKIISIRCPPCNKTFMTWSGLKRHNESEHTLINLNSLKCKFCGKIFKNRQTLKMHEKTHEERRLSVCDVCGKGFTSAAILRAHLETHKENRERRFTCEHCGKKFYTNTILLSHVSRLHSGKRFICQVCSYPFTDKYNLVKHLRRHEGKKFHKCDICEKSFATPSTLIEHKRIHSGERPYVCMYCPKGFISKKRLTDHVRIHTGDKPYKCMLCDQKFTQRSTLKRHMKVHDRIVPTIS